MKTRFFSIILLAAAVMYGCSESAPEFEGDGYVEPRDEITTLNPISVTLESATLRGSCYVQDVPFVERGFFFADEPMETAELADGTFGENVERFADAKTDDGLFTHDLEGLSLGQLYYFIAYVKLSSGGYRFGEELSFLPDYLDVTPADAPAASATPETYKTASVEIRLGGFGTENLVGLDASLLQLHDVGVYLWRDDTEAFGQAQRISLGAGDQTRLIKANETVNISLRSLKGGTDYSIVPYVVIGVWRSYSSGVYLMEEMCGDPAGFTTEPTPLPSVTTLAPASTTTFSTVLNGVMVSDGGDEAPEVGFYISDDQSTLVSDANKYTVNFDNGADTFSQYVSGLSHDTEYFICTYIVSMKGTPDEQTVYGVVESFRSATLTVPVVTSAAMNYAWRFANVTTTDASIKCTITDGIDPSLSGYGIMWGTDPDHLTSDAAGMDLDVQSGEFTITLGSLTHSTTYYYKPYATNGAGTFLPATPLSFRTAVDGGKEWLYNAAANTNDYMYNRVSQSLSGCADIVYYELDPITGATATYYLLDRNLNARDRYVTADIGIRISNNDPSEELRQRVGAYYQWGIGTPSMTWEFPAAAAAAVTTFCTKWVQGVAQEYTEWSVNPCPTGYDIPTKAQFLDMVDAAKGTGVQTDMLTLFNTMRLGPTAFAGAADGARNPNDPYACVLWTRDVANSTGATESFRVYIASTGTPAGIVSGPPRAACAPIRCVRVVANP